MTHSSTRMIGTLLLCATVIAPSMTNAQTLTDLVQDDLRTVATHETLAPFHRTGVQQRDGLYGVRIVNEEGRLRMSGTYADSTCTTAQGAFYYYHPNGRLESNGQFVNGIKSGVWSRYGINGVALAERIYDGMSLEDMEVAMGLMTRATTIAPASVIKSGVGSGSGL